MKIIEKLLFPTKWKRLLFFVISDTLIIGFSFLLSFYLRFGFTFPEKYSSHFSYWLVGIIIFNLAFLSFFGLYRITWRFTGLTELLNLIKAAAVSTFLIYILNMVFRFKFENKFDLPRGVIIISGILSFLLIGILRISKRVYLEIFRQSKIGKKVLIIGADFTGKRLIKELAYDSKEKLFPVAIVDEDPIKIGTQIEGLSIYGGYEKIPDVMKRFDIESVLINLPKASNKRIAHIFDIVKKAGVPDIKVVPRVNEYGTSVHRHKDFKQLDIEDLLSRRSVKIEFEEIGAYLMDRTVLVTGASGSIGSEIMRALIHFGVLRLIAYEIDETRLFNLERELSVYKKDDQKIQFVVGDVRDQEKLKKVFSRFKPEIVFHTAAYKHVPLMEDFPEEAVKTNILGSYNLMETASQHGVLKLINISTDKAVNPVSLMGASKRMSEIIGRVYDPEKFKVISVRFGNVLGSRGSVIPIFLEQIRNGGPITVTHREMKRYFMSISEAVLLVLQAAYMGEGGEVFVLDMGEPVNILTLAETLIRLNNLTPYEDIDIKFSGLRPGEKLFEELLTAEEGTDVTRHEKIYVARNSSRRQRQEVKSIILQLQTAINEPEKLKKILKNHVPFYK